MFSSINLPWRPTEADVLALISEPLPNMTPTQAWDIEGLARQIYPRYKEVEASFRVISGKEYEKAGEHKGSLINWGRATKGFLELHWRYAAEQCATEVCRLSILYGTNEDIRYAEGRLARAKRERSRATGFSFQPQVVS